MSKGSSPRPFSISQEEFGERLDTIFGKKPPKQQWVPPPLPGQEAKAKPQPEVLDAYNDERLVSKFDKQALANYQCWCYNCLDKIENPATGFPITMSTFIVCPDCGNKRCPKATDHNLACTGSNEPGQPGSRY